MRKPYQVEILPESATFERLQDGTYHFGQAQCPICETVNVLRSNTLTEALAFTKRECIHNEGVIQGHQHPVMLFR